MGNAMATSNDLTGRVFGRLTVLSCKEKPRVWVCLCSCGVTTEVITSRLNSGNTKSCGCLKRTILGDLRRTHGMANSRVKGYAIKAYGVWQAMRDRCSNPNRADFHRYGGRGISVCQRWEKFENFYADMGEPPTGTSLDRIDNDKGYSKKNCRWATRKEQVYNSTCIKYVVIKGVSKPLQVWLKESGIKRDTYYRRVRKGFTKQEALQQGEAK